MRILFFVFFISLISPFALSQGPNFDNLSIGGTEDGDDTTLDNSTYSFQDLFGGNPEDTDISYFLDDSDLENRDWDSFEDDDVALQLTHPEVFTSMPLQPPPNIPITVLTAMKILSNEIGASLLNFVIKDFTENGLPEFIYELKADAVLLQMDRGMIFHPNLNFLNRSLESLMDGYKDLDPESQLNTQEMVFHRLKQVIVNKETLVTVIGDTFELAGEEYFMVFLNAKSPKGEICEFRGFLPVEVLRLVSVKKLG